MSREAVSTAAGQAEAIVGTNAHEQAGVMPSSQAGSPAADRTRVAAASSSRSIGMLRSLYGHPVDSPALRSHGPQGTGKTNQKAISYSSFQRMARRGVAGVNPNI